MRPLPSSSFSIDGMLFSTLVSRRAPQKPEVIVTACTGTFRNLACGDFARFNTPWSFHPGFVEEFTGVEGDADLPRGGHARLPRGSEPAAAAETAVLTNCRREISERFVISAPQQSHEFKRISRDHCSVQSI